MSDDALTTVLYTSSARHAFDDEALASLLVASRESNARRDITGMLLYREGQFLQILEGGRSAVLELMERIRGDSRHGDVRVLLEAPLVERRFEDWSMGYQPVAEPTQPLPEGFRDTFDDVERAGEAPTSVVLRAALELSVWFRVRAGAAARPAEQAEQAEPASADVRP